MDTDKHRCRQTLPFTRGVNGSAFGTPSDLRPSVSICGFNCSFQDYGFSAANGHFLGLDLRNLTLWTQDKQLSD
jgi:hypothetical protein